MKVERRVVRAGKTSSSRSETRTTFDWTKAKKYRFFYVLLIYPVVYIFIFNYIPMYGVVIAFKDFKMGRGIMGSSWNNFEHFKFLFTDVYFFRVLRNTLIINLYNLVFGFPAPIILAILINELGNLAFKKVSQTISYLPHFLSWVVLAALFTDFLSPASGPINAFLGLFGINPIYFLASTKWFRPVIVATGIWQGMGWGSIIYLAAISAVDPQLYEAASIDGASRFGRIIHITLPSIMPAITILLILRMGTVMATSFDQIFNLLSPIVYEVGDVISTYVYRRGILEAQYDYGAAVGLFVNVVGVFLLVATNFIVKKISDYTLW